MGRIKIIRDAGEAGRMCGQMTQSDFLAAMGRLT
jgi:hypothetical protein